ncbi:hypothetical protein HGH92_05040 [Chitinophaga varians]|uniref:Lipoprotein n=1 Tax=Chitinophaga varians TaxID=2202339 RepID=A0A847RSA1_9BACT|nr:hypothetical protein [Chitinophaga varians]NLR63667.1 hypothetical protein [Chitinophaga varians]
MKQLFIGLIITISITGCKTAVVAQKKDKMDATFEKFDFESWDNNYANYKKGTTEYSYFMKDGAEIYPDITGTIIIPPKPDFYSIYKSYYKNNGHIKEKGKLLGIKNSLIKIGTWYYFDSTSTKPREVNEDKKFGKFDYNKLLTFLTNKGDINIHTGMNRDKLEIEFYSTDSSLQKLWKVYLLQEVHDLGDKIGMKGRLYFIDGNTGEMIKSEQLSAYKGVYPQALYMR